MKENNVLVSVCMITYNHEKYIRDAIEGVIVQKTDFPVELIIGEDCSKDKTRDICLGYKKKYPDLIRLQLPEKNNGAFCNFILTMQAAQGKYIALCEGDDFWVDSHKLQKQIEILEQNNDVVAVVTNSSICDANNNMLHEERNVVPGNKTGKYNLHDFLRDEHQYPTLTAVFRTEAFRDISDKLKKLSNKYLADWILWVLLLTKGKFYFLNEVTASYRINPTSVTHTVNTVNRWKEDFVIRKKLIEILDKEYYPYLKNNWHAYFRLSWAYKKQHKYLRFIYYQFCSFFSHPVKYFNQLKNLF